MVLGAVHAVAPACALERALLAHQRAALGAVHAGAAVAHSLKERAHLPVNVESVEVAVRRPANERLETLGDAWLKAYMCLFIMQTRPILQEEGLISEFRSNLVCNARLTKEAVKCDLVSYMHPLRSMLGRPFLEHWMPALMAPPSPGPQVGWKTPADCVEAILGCCLILGGEAAPQAMLRFVGLPTLSNYVTPETGAAISALTLEQAVAKAVTTGLRGWGLGGGGELVAQLQSLPPGSFFDVEFIGTEPAAATVQSLHSLERSLGYTFTNKWLPLQAVTHASSTAGEQGRTWPTSDGGSIPARDYQRLELLGDALLSYLTTAKLFLHEEEYGTTTPFIITKKVAACVCNSALASVGTRKLNLQHHLSVVEGYFKDLSEGTARDAPKALADAFEALVAAVYMDAGFDMAAVSRIFWPLLEGYARGAQNDDIQDAASSESEDEDDDDALPAGASGSGVLPQRTQHSLRSIIAELCG
ncbi:ribonuclease III domain-containing protein [Tribonema minus]|uniref:Ribonuclease III domain-containing protein n=1 Tax=Tribonema minus TaxID=303371 RepID=A0A835Z3Y3_9STRA|nr:ribonuclease III domain-containing protein [Tribonema minus]